jgi:hypothetical protein
MTAFLRCLGITRGIPRAAGGLCTSRCVWPSMASGFGTPLSSSSHAVVPLEQPAPASVGLDSSNALGVGFATFVIGGQIIALVGLTYITYIASRWSSEIGKLASMTKKIGTNKIVENVELLRLDIESMTNKIDLELELMFKDTRIPEKVRRLASGEKPRDVVAASPESSKASSKCR